MSRLEIVVSHSTKGFYPLAGTPISEEDLARGRPWPHPARWIVRIHRSDTPYFVDVEVNTDEDGPYVSGIAARLVVPTWAGGTPEDPWLEGAKLPRLVARDIQRLPLATYMNMALVSVRDSLTRKGQAELKKILAPRRGRGADFYRKILETARDLEAKGKRPVPEIARQRRVSENVVSQWLTRARRIEGEAPPRKKRRRMRKERNDGPV